MSTLIYKLFYTKRKLNLGHVFGLAVVWIFNIVNIFKINLPPTLLQLDKGQTDVWIGRIFGLICIWISILIFYKIISSLFSTKIAIVWVFLVSMSPLITTLWWINTIDCYWFLLVTLGIWMCFNYEKLWVLLALILMLVNINKYKDTSPLYRVFDIKSLSGEINLRVLQEDSLTYRNELPLAVRRLGYNKLTFLSNKLLREINSFFDSDSWFFAEIHPNNNKTMVILFWPVFFIFVVGIYYVVRFDNKQRNFLVGLFLIALVYFLTKDGKVSERFLLILWPLAIICSLGMVVNKKWWKIIMSVLLTYGYISNWHDMSNRMMYWFDNRPIAVEFLFKNIPKNFDRVYFTNLVAGGNDYCRYFLNKNRCDSKIGFSGFDLSKGVIEKGVYAGFLGEFVGKDYNNNFGDGWEKKITDKGLRILAVTMLENTIANQYGNYLIVAEK